MMIRLVIAAFLTSSGLGRASACTVTFTPATGGPSVSVQVTWDADCTFSQRGFSAGDVVTTDPVGPRRDLAVGTATRHSTASKR